MKVMFFFSILVAGILPAGALGPSWEQGTETQAHEIAGQARQSAIALTRRAPSTKFDPVNEYTKLKFLVDVLSGAQLHSIAFAPLSPYILEGTWKLYGYRGVYDDRPGAPMSFDFSKISDWKRSVTFVPSTTNAKAPLSLKLGDGSAYPTSLYFDGLGDFSSIGAGGPHLPDCKMITEGDVYAKVPIETYLVCYFSPDDMVPPPGASATADDLARRNTIYLYLPAEPKFGVPVEDGFVKTHRQTPVGFAFERNEAIDASLLPGDFNLEGSWKRISSDGTMRWGSWSGDSGARRYYRQYQKTASGCVSAFKMYLHGQPIYAVQWTKGQVFGTALFNYGGNQIAEYSSRSGGWTSN